MFRLIILLFVVSSIYADPPIEWDVDSDGVFDDIAAFAMIFNEVFELSGLMALSRPQKRKSHEKYQKRAFWQHRHFGTKIGEK